MKNIIFNENDYNNLSPDEKALYTKIGVNIYELTPSKLRLDLTHLPEYLSQNQYLRFNFLNKKYELIRYGICRQTIKLYRLIPSLITNLGGQKDLSMKKPDDYLTEDAFWRLPNEKKAKYQRVSTGLRIYYYPKG